MKVLFVLGFPNPFTGAGWTRIGFYANAWSGKGCSIEILGTFSYTLLQRKGFIFSSQRCSPEVKLLKSKMDRAIDWSSIF